MTTTDHPTTAPEAARAGWLYSPMNYDGKVEQGRYRQHCRRDKCAMIHVCPRKAYSRIDVQMPEGQELSPTMAIVILRALRHHRSPGRVRIDGAILEKIPTDDAVSLAREFVALLTPLPAALVL